MHRVTETQFTTDGTQVRSDWRLNVTADMVLQRQGANPGKIRERQPKLVEVAERALAEGTPLIRPQVAYRIVEITEVKPLRVVLKNAPELVGNGIARKLAGAKFAIAVVATIGAGIEAMALHAAKEDAVYGLALDGYGTAAIGALTVELRTFFTECAVLAKLTTTSALYPGTDDWELAAAQAQLFSIVDASKVGVHLTPSFLMRPCKSVSLVIGAGEKMHAGGKPCEECGAAANCTHRLAEG
jgi:hypothetical protein